MPLYTSPMQTGSYASVCPHLHMETSHNSLATLHNCDIQYPSKDQSLLLMTKSTKTLQKTLRLHHTKEDHLKTPKFDEKFNSSSSSLDCIGYDLTKSTIKRLYSSIGYDLIKSTTTELYNSTRYDLTNSTTEGIYSFTLPSIILSSFGRQFSHLLT